MSETRSRPSFMASMLMPPLPEPGILLRITGVTLGQTYLVEPVTDSLDAAWAEAEAALPEGWGVRITFCKCDPEDHEVWRISSGENLAGRTSPTVYVEGTPAAALRALTAKLREVGR